MRSEYNVEVYKHNDNDTDGWLVIDNITNQRVFIPDNIAAIIGDVLSGDNTSIRSFRLAGVSA